MQFIKCDGIHSVEESLYMRSQAPYMAYFETTDLFPGIYNVK